MINTKLQSIIDTKSAIGNAIVNKGGTITSETPFFNYASEIDNISTGGGAYSTFVAQAQDNSKYTVYNGYHPITNPTPNLSNNFAFNRWFLNNSATGDVVFSNVLLIQLTNLNATVPLQNNSVGINAGYMPFVDNTANYGGTIFSITTNNGFLYVGGQTNNTVQKFYEGNLVLVNNTASYGGQITSVTTNNGFIYAGGSVNLITKYNESTLTFVSNSVSYGGAIQALTANNSFIYAVGTTDASFQNGALKKYHESNLVFSASAANHTGTIRTVTTNNGFVYIGGSGNFSVRKYHESNLTLVGSTNSYGGTIFSVKTNNGFIYVTGGFNVAKYHESNLAFVDKTADGLIEQLSRTLTTNDGFVYAATSNSLIQKFYESNLTKIGNSVPFSTATVHSITVNNGSLYIARNFFGDKVFKFIDQSNNLVETPIFEITTIKE
jgi:hypothetical protein